VTHRIKSKEIIFTDLKPMNYYLELTMMVNKYFYCKIFKNSEWN